MDANTNRCPSWASAQEVRPHDLVEFPYGGLVVQVDDVKRVDAYVAALERRETVAVIVGRTFDDAGAARPVRGRHRLTAPIKLLNRPDRSD